MDKSSSESSYDQSDNQQSNSNDQSNNDNDNYSNNDPNNNFQNNIPNNYSNSPGNLMARTYNPAQETSLLDDKDEKSKEKNSNSKQKPPKLSLNPVELQNPIIRSKNDEKKVKDFGNLMKKKECLTFLLDFGNYIDCGNENGFTVFKKKYESRSGRTLQSRSKSESQLLSYTKKYLNIDKLSEMKKQFLSHFYETFPSSFNQEYLFAQICCYMKNINIALANFKGYSMTNKEGSFFPSFLTERPVNESISSLFETIQKNKSEDNENKIKRTQSFNVDDIKVFNPDQKFALICGTTNGIAFIHQNLFIHSNLSPKTVYLDEYFHPKICDYIFIPSFKVTTVKNEEDKIYYKFNVVKKEQIQTDNQIYVAPEILNGGEFGQPADIYSLGLLIYFILAEKDPIFDNGHIIYPDDFGEEWKNLIDRCISVDADSRPTALSILEELLDNSKMTKFISTISKESSTEISQRNELYYMLLRKSIDIDFDFQLKEFDIFHNMIANQDDIDDDTELIILAAERGDAKSMKKVGDFFFYGQNNILQDESSAYNCYQEAATNGDVEAMILAAQFSEKGIGCEIKYEKAYKFYDMAINKITPSDPKYLEIKSKKEEMRNKIEQSRTITLIDVPLSVENQAIQNLYSKYKMKIERIPPKEGEDHQQVKMIFDSDLHYSNTIKKLTKANKDFFIIDEKPIKFTYPSNKHSEITRFESLKKYLPVIDIDDYIPGPGNKEFQSIGSGAYAITYLVYKKDDPTKCYAAKVIKRIEGEQQMNFFKREVISASRFKHPAIVHYAGFSEYNLVSREKKISDEPSPTLLMNFIPKGNLEKIIKNQPDEWNDTTKLIVIIGIVNGMAEMYSKNIVHRDLKPENIVLNENFEPVICDFGCSRHYSNYKALQMSRSIGSLIYMAPELLNLSYDPIYKFEVDVYSFGIILYQILTDKTFNRVYPKKDMTSKLKISQDKQNNYVGDFDDDDDVHQILIDLVKACWNASIDTRPDPVTIFNELVDAVNKGVMLLPSADLDKVREYIKTLPKY